MDSTYTPQDTPPIPFHGLEMLVKIDGGHITVDTNINIEAEHWDDLNHAVISTLMYNMQKANPDLEILTPSYWFKILDEAAKTAITRLNEET